MFRDLSHFLFLFSLNLIHSYSEVLNNNNLDTLQSPSFHVHKPLIIDNNVRFFLYPDPINLHYKEELNPWDEKSLKVSNYNPNLFLKIIIHGFMGDYTDYHPQELKNAYLKQGYPVNVIMVDWNLKAKPRLGFIGNLILGYPLAAQYLDTVGEKTKELIIFLTKHRALFDPSSVHIIGFSMGAHIAGITGHSYKLKTHLTLGRITGLDPAGIQYNLPLKTFKKLDKADAHFVDVVHSNQGVYGILGQIGNVDFYVNGGGPIQPGCSLPYDTQKDIPGLPGSCAHDRAWDFYIQSVYNTELKACRASSYLDFKDGICVEPDVFGEFTTAKWGQYFLDLPIKTNGYGEHHLGYPNPGDPHVIPIVTY